MSPRSIHRRHVELTLAAEVPGWMREPARDRDVVDFVLSQLDALPVPVRTGVDAAAVALAPWTTRPRPGSVVPQPAFFPPAVLYARLIRSLVLFAAFDAATPRSVHP
jgi:hypothetical protein